MRDEPKLDVLQGQSRRLGVETPWSRAAVEEAQKVLTDPLGYGDPFSETETFEIIEKTMGRGLAFSPSALRKYRQKPMSIAWLVEATDRFGPASIRRRLAKLWCCLTDHDYIDPDGAPEPFCRRCGCSTYWPVRKTIGRFLEDGLHWLARRLRRGDEIPFVLAALALAVLLAAPAVAQDLIFADGFECGTIEPWGGEPCKEENPVAAQMTYLLDLDSVDPADSTDVITSYFATGEGFVTGPADTPASQVYQPGLLSKPELVVELADDGMASGAASAREVTVDLARHLFGVDRLAALDGREILNRHARLVAVGTGGDGTVYSYASPAVVADGVVSSTSRSSHTLTLSIRPSSRAHRVELGRTKLLGYPNGLRFDGNSAEAAVPDSTIPAAFTLQALVLVPRIWSVGASDRMTVAAARSAHLYFERDPTDTWRRRLGFEYTTTAAAIVTVNGPTFDAREQTAWLSVRVDTAAGGGGVDVRFGVDQAFADGASASAFVESVENWKLGRYRTSSTDSADTIIGAWALFDEWLSDRVLVNRQNGRLVGDEPELVWYFPGEATGVTLFDYATVNAASPLNATITTATAAPLFEGKADMVGTVLPDYIGHVRNAPLIPIDPARLIYRIGRDIGSGYQVLDRSVPYTLTTYSSPLDLWDATAPAAGNAYFTPHLGGIVRLNEIDGSDSTANVTGASLWDSAMWVPLDYTITEVSSFFISGTVGTFNGGQWAIEMWLINLGSSPTLGVGSYARMNEVFEITEVENNDGSFTLRAKVSYGVGEIVLDYSRAWEVGSAVAIRLEAVDDGADVTARLLINGRVDQSDVAVGQSLPTGLSARNLLFGNSPHGAFSILPIRIWSAAGTSDANAETLHRTYLYSNPSPSATNLAGMWLEHHGDPTILIDDTSSGNNGNVSSVVRWAPGMPATDRISAVHQILERAGITPTERESAYDFDPSAVGRVYDSPISVARAAAELLRGGGLYLVLKPDGTAIIGMVVDPALATPAGTILVEDADPAVADGPPPSDVRATWGENPHVQEEGLAGADAALRSYAAREVREVTEEISDNRDVYDDEPPPQGRSLLVDTAFADQRPAVTEAQRIGLVWKSPRPVRALKLIHADASSGSGGFNAVELGEIYTIRWREPGPVTSGPLTVREETVMLLAVTQAEEFDTLKAR